MTTSVELDVPPKGSLEKTGFARIMRAVAKAKATGSLYLLSGKTKKVVFFEEGQPVFVRSNVLAECLGQVLVQERLITEEQCNQTLEAIRRTGKKQGELLVEMGVLSEGNLRYGLETQLRTKLFDVFAWESGRYQFKPGPSKEGFRIRLDRSAESVIVEGILERVSETRAKAALAASMDAFPRRDRNAPRVNLLPEERHFLRCLDGSQSVAEILDDPPNDLVPRPATLLYALLQSGSARLESRRADATRRPPPPDLTPKDLPLDELALSLPATSTRTEFEDTPPPGPLPTDPDLMGDDDFDIEDMDASTVADRSAIEDLLAAEPELEEEVFDDEDVELLDEDAIEVLEEDEEVAYEAVEEAAETYDEDWSAAEDLAREAGADPDDLLALDELEFVDLGAGFSAPPPATSTPAHEEASDPEMAGAMHFSAGEQALSAGDYETAVAELEAAFELGVDVPELHAMLAYARFQTAPDDPAMQAHALELLDYAEELNPDLDLVHAYRGAILRAMGDPANARLSLERALEINPYCEVAMQLMDSMS
ncbi:MAG: DUF4388 domain-containing protein [Deltaproteobacteria bacterium]|nr:MAG: DUF4388 domain-containing protein [Deltaproteobacteria bacterium]